jgi:ABC-type Fe3+-hydroxamate transport system substrate-binding protein
MRVVSLVPSATETLAAWGVSPIAVTRFCGRPDLPQVGGTKDPDVGAILDLAPDLVVMCEEENRRADADVLSGRGLALHVVRVGSVDGVDSEMRRLAAAVGRSGPNIDLPPPRPTRVRAFVPIWRRPWMTLNGATYGSSLLGRLGVANVFADDGQRYPETTLAEAAARRPDVVLAPSEPYPFSERFRTELEEVAPVALVDGQDLFWWGARTEAALGRLARVVDAIAQHDD